MHKAFFYLIAILLLAAGYPLLQERFGEGWLYFLVVAVVLLITRYLANTYGKKK